VCHIVIRDKKPPVEEEPERKERVIHTRVPESLEAELRGRAERLGISVSNLVRNVLGHAFGLVGDVVADSQAIARAARARAPREAPEAREDEASFEDVLGWQQVALAKNAVCVRCNAILARGSDAGLGITERSARVVVCVACMEELRK
jgi:RNase P subunit RPR2